MQTQNTQNTQTGAFAHIVALDNMRNTFKGLSDRAIFKQLLLKDVLNIIDTKTSNSYMALEDIRQYFRIARSGEHLSNSFYLKLYEQKWSFTSWDDRWYRAMQSINNGTDLTIKKIAGKLYAFANTGDDFKGSLLEMGATDWTANYNR